MSAVARSTDVLTELDRQVEVLVDHHYPQALGLAPDRFRDALSPVRAAAADLSVGAADDERTGFVLVVGAGLLTAATAIRLTELDGCPGFTTMDADDLARFTATADADVPDGFAYLLVDVDPGADLRGVPPQHALPVMLGRGRSPLTVHEGIALTTLRPDLLRTGRRYSLLASRCGDRRVPAIWVSGRRPRLGWCWDGAPHAWLGSASCAERVGSSA